MNNLYEIDFQEKGSTRLLYCVKDGDTLSEICREFGVIIEQVLKANPFLTKTTFNFKPRDPNGNLLYPGDIINLPCLIAVKRDRRYVKRRIKERRANFDFHDGRRAQNWEQKDRRKNK